MSERKGQSLPQFLGMKNYLDPYADSEEVEGAETCVGGDGGGASDNGGARVCGGSQQPRHTMISC